MWIRSQHGKFRLEAQRLKSKVSGQEQTDLELSGEFAEGYISPGLKELVGYYSNRLSYEEVSRLLERLSGQPLLSDQKAEQLVLEQAERISQALMAELAEFEQQRPELPDINRQVDLYDAQSEDILLFADGIQVKQQATKREKRNQTQAETSKPRSFAQTHLVMLAKAGGGYEYMSELLPNAPQSATCLAQQVRRCLVAEYGQRQTPLNLVAITDGAATLRALLLAVCGVMIPLILDWYHLEKKVTELMSMIAWNKREKERHLQVILASLWRGLTDEARAYLGTLKPRNPDRLQELLTYLQKHRSEIIDYQRRQQLGKAIGCGRMEKGCDQVIGHRQKKKGMSWSLIGSRSLALLRVAELNGRWQQLWSSQPCLT